MRAVYLRNFRKGLATNSSSTHCVIYKNKDDIFEDLNIELDYYDRYDKTIAATKDAKIKYILANIMYDEDLVKLMLIKYPKMKKYLTKIRKHMKTEYDNVFGMYYRGKIVNSLDMNFKIEYLSGIIENDDIIIIGGSDENDFVNDKIKNHYVLPLDEKSYYEKTDVIKNGNYWLKYTKNNDGYSLPKKINEEDYDLYYKCYGNKLRFSTHKDYMIPQYPELIDIRITNKCNHGCKFCFMDSNMKENDADINFLKLIIDSCRIKTEFSIGGGNILLYPYLEEFLEYIKIKGHIANVTINVKDCDTIINNEKLKNIFTKYIDGIGISITDKTDIDIAYNFQNVIDKTIDDYMNGLYKHYSYSNTPYYKKKYCVYHIIPEYLGLKKTLDILSNLKPWYNNVLFLGYKTNGRGVSQKYHTFNDNELTKIWNSINNGIIAIDTTFANNYKEWLTKTFECEHTITFNEGEYSMYVDAVNSIAYKSSYQLNKPYLLKNPFNLPDFNDISDDDTKSKIINDYHKLYDLNNAFSNIRKDEGFELYENIQKHYWNK